MPVLMRPLKKGVKKMSNTNTNTSRVTFLSDVINGCFISDNDADRTVVETEDYDRSFIVAELSEGFSDCVRFDVSHETAVEINKIFGIYTGASSGKKIEL